MSRSLTYPTPDSGLTYTWTTGPQVHTVESISTISLKVWNRLDIGTRTLMGIQDTGMLEICSTMQHYTFDINSVEITGHMFS